MEIECNNKFIVQFWDWPNTKNQKSFESFKGDKLHGIQRQWHENGNAKFCRRTLYGYIYGINQNWNENATREIIDQNKKGLNGPKIIFKYS